MGQELKYSFACTEIWMILPLSGTKNRNRSRREKIYQPKTKEREVLQIQFGQQEEVDPVEEKKEKQKKESKLNQSIKRLKEQNEKEKQEEFTVD